MLSLLVLLPVAWGFSHYESDLVINGGAWFVFNDTAFNTSVAPLECDDSFGIQRVPDSCCEIIPPYFGLALSDFFTEYNCLATNVLLADGKGVRPYLGCDDDMITYVRFFLVFFKFLCI